MTLADLEKIPRNYLLADEIAEYLGAHPHTIRWQAQHESEKLGFPVIVTGKMVKIPKDGFLYYCRFGRPQINVEMRPEALQYCVDLAVESRFSQLYAKGGGSR